MRRRLAMVGAIVLLAFSMRPAKLFRDAPSIRVHSKEVSKGRIDAPIVLTGAVHTPAPITVSAPVSGAVHSVVRGVGTFVHAGDVLARIDAAAYGGALTAAEKELDQARAEDRRKHEDLEALERQCAAEGRLAINPIVELVELRATEAAVQQAENDVRESAERVSRAKAALARAAADQQAGVLRAPVDGVIVSIEPDEPRFQIARDVGSIELTTELTARDIRAVQVGDRAAVPLGSSTLSGTVVAIEQDATAMPTAVIQVAATSRELPPGARCPIVFDGARRRSTVRVPNAAFSFNPSADLLQIIGELHVPTVSLLTHTEHPLHVWTYDNGGFTRIEIRAGDHDAQFTELVDGPLRPGDRVVTSASVPEE